MNRIDFPAIIEYAKRLGPADVQRLPARDIPVADHLAELCGGGRCTGFGQSMSCPPNVAKPSEFREEIRAFSDALVFKFDVATEVLLGDGRFEAARLVHETAAAIERYCMGAGCRRARGYAAASCKQVFCDRHPRCAVLHGEGPCRFPESARVSMSGMGIDFFELSRRLGWRFEKITRETNPDTAPLGMMAGMVLMG